MYRGFAQNGGGAHFERVEKGTFAEEVSCVSFVFDTVFGDDANSARIDEILV